MLCPRSPQIPLGFLSTLAPCVCSHTRGSGCWNPAQHSRCLGIYTPNGGLIASHIQIPAARFPDGTAPRVSAAGSRNSPWDHAPTASLASTPTLASFISLSHIPTPLLPFLFFFPLIPLGTLLNKSLSHKSLPQSPLLGTQPETNTSHPGVIMGIK